jgi:proline dehydrogenase
MKTEIDPQVAFRHKSDKQLKKERFLFKSMNSSFLVWFFSKTAGLLLSGISPFKGLIRKTIFRQFCAGETLEESKKVVADLKSKGVGAILDYSKEGKGSVADFEDTVKNIKEVVTLANKERAIPYASVKLTGVMDAAILEKMNEGKATDDMTKAEYDKAMVRLDDLFSYCYKLKVPIYIDAEETWMQNTIDRISEYFMEKYNHEEAIVNTTVQMYRWDRLDYLKDLIKQAEAKRYFAGIKIVRGAYMEKENERANKNNVKSPISEVKAYVDRDFNEAVSYCLHHLNRVRICVGTHNESSTISLINQMEELRISKSDSRIYFSQLFGMSDHITYDLAAQGYNVTKYVPFGPLKSALPYLVRRAQENTSIAGQTNRELDLIRSEMERRKQQKLLR